MNKSSVLIFSWTETQKLSEISISKKSQIQTCFSLGANSYNSFSTTSLNEDILRIFLSAKFTELCYFSNDVLKNQNNPCLFFNIAIICQKSSVRDSCTTNSSTTTKKLEFILWFLNRAKKITRKRNNGQDIPAMPKNEVNIPRAWWEIVWP